MEDLFGRCDPFPTGRGLRGLSGHQAAGVATPTAAASTGVDGGVATPAPAGRTPVPAASCRRSSPSRFESENDAKVQNLSLKTKRM